MTQNDLARCSVDGTDPFGLELPRLYMLQTRSKKLGSRWNKKNSRIK